MTLSVWVATIQFMQQSHFTIQATSGQARAGIIHTPHGDILTPAFVPCATHGSLRGVSLAMLTPGGTSEVDSLVSSEVSPGARLNLQLILANVYHLMLRPGIETIEALGGLHQFMNWDRAIITDSGGFQAFALSQFARYEKEGIRFRSHLDGSERFVTPQTVIDSQQRLGVDITTCLDVCTGFPASEAEVAAAVDQTNEWAVQSVKAWTKRDMLLYGMVQGSIYLNLRQRSAEFLRDLPFAGFAIGGNMYTFGQTIAQLAREKPQMWETVAYTTSLLPPDKPRHLLGVGEPNDLVAGVAAGIDTFDCVMATRIARHGSGWVQVQPLGLNRENASDYERVNFAAARWRRSELPVDPHCCCPACSLGYSRAYLRHLLTVGDPLGGQLLSIHNVAFLTNLMAEIRRSIVEGTFDAIRSSSF